MLAGMVTVIMDCSKHSPPQNHSHTTNMVLYLLCMFSEADRLCLVCIQVMVGWDKCLRISKQVAWIQVNWLLQGKKKTSITSAWDLVCNLATYQACLFQLNLLCILNWFPQQTNKPTNPKHLGSNIKTPTYLRAWILFCCCCDQKTSNAKHRQ